MTITSMFINGMDITIHDITTSTYINDVKMYFKTQDVND